MAQVLNVSEFKLQLHYYIYFWTNALLGKVWLPYTLSYGLNSIVAVFLQILLWH